MSISFDTALGLHEQALSFRAQRSEVLANNIANADTPGYKARDMDFSAVLAQQAEQAKNGSFSMSTDNAQHISASVLGDTDAALKYRNASNPSLDQNTVDAQVEQADYAENTVNFEASFTLLNQRLKGLMSAVKGE